MMRPIADADAASIIALIGGCWAEYPGCVMDVDNENPELRAFATHCARKGGAGWITDDGIGMVAAYPLGSDAAWEIGRMYVARTARGTGLAHALLDVAEGHARANGARRLVLWTDTRFEAAHRFYEKRSYVKQGAIRVLDDLSGSLEFRYTKPLGPRAIEVLDAQAASSAERSLAEILIGCVAAGASVSFRPPLSMEKARAFWRRTTAQVAANERLLLIAWADGTLAGTVTVDLATSENQPHRGEVQKLLVHPAHRGRGIGRALMRAAEQAAARVGRTLLTLDGRAGDPAEGLYRSLGWTEAGRIPGYTRDADGSLSATVIFYRNLREGS